MSRSEGSACSAMVGECHQATEKGNAENRIAFLISVYFYELRRSFSLCGRQCRGVGCGLANLVQGVAVGMGKGLALAGDGEHGFLLIRPGAVWVLGDGDGVGVGSEGVLQKRVA